MTNLEIILAVVVALQGFTSIRFEVLGRQVKRSLMPPPLPTYEQRSERRTERRLEGPRPDQSLAPEDKTSPGGRRGS